MAFRSCGPSRRTSTPPASNASRASSASATGCPSSRTAACSTWRTSSGARASAPAIDWLDIPGVAHDDPVTERGVVPGQPGLYFVGQLFLYSVSSAMVHGLARDARHVARHIDLSQAR